MFRRMLEPGRRADPRGEAWAKKDSAGYRVLQAGLSLLARPVKRISTGSGKQCGRQRYRMHLLLQGGVHWKKQTLRLRFTLMPFVLVAFICWYFADFSGVSEAATALPLAVREVEVSIAPGDQLSPDIESGTVVFLDKSIAGADRLLIKNLTDGQEREFASAAGIWAGPAIDGGRVAWQTSDSQVCLRPLAGGLDRCIAAPPAAALALSGSTALIKDSGSTIRLLDFNTMRSRMLDSYDVPNMRYDPDIDSSQAVWVKERGYAGKYYEPLIVSYDLTTGVSTYLTKLGGGTGPEGGSKYLRRHPSISNGRVIYQQKINEHGQQWDIFATSPDTYGVPVVEEPGDQINPSFSGNLVVYQDNRGGYFDETGQWVGEWNIYLKDLETNIEQPVCTAPGDQINPVIKGNTVVWEDNRNGSWDIYGAILSQAPVEPPELALSINSIFWGSYQDYLAGELTVRYLLANKGSGSANSVSIEKVITNPSQVVVAAGVPGAISLLGPGESGVLEIRYCVPPGVKRFKTILYATCKDSSGSELWFPSVPPDQ